MTNVNNEANLRVQNLRVKKIKGLQEGSPDFLIGVDADGLVTQIATDDIGGGGGGGSISDGDKGDITVSSTGTVWTIDNQAVTSGKIASNAVTSGKIDTGAVTEAKIASNAVTTDKINNNAVTQTKLSATGAAAGRVLQTDGTNMSWAAPSGGSLIPLTTAIADCENTTAEINVLSVTIPANANLAVGDVIIVDFFASKYADVTGGTNNQSKILNGSSVMIDTSIYSISQTGLPVFHSNKLKFFITSISGGTVTLNGISNTASNGAPADTNGFAFAAINAQNGASTIRYSINNTFSLSSGTTIHIANKFSVQNANVYLRMLQAQAYIIKKAV